MEKNITELLYLKAKKFRQAIESLDDDDIIHSEHFKNFPRGCCGDASDLLLKYYIDNNIEVEYVWGINKYRQSHRWLEYNQEILIDITADQFEDINQPITITKDKIWYLQFKNQNRSNCNFEQYADFNAKRLRELYNKILKKM